MKPIASSTPTTSDIVTTAKTPSTAESSIKSRYVHCNDNKCNVSQQMFFDTKATGGTFLLLFPKLASNYGEKFKIEASPSCDPLI